MHIQNMGCGYSTILFIFLKLNLSQILNQPTTSPACYLLLLGITGMDHPAHFITRLLMSLVLLSLKLWLYKCLHFIKLQTFESVLRVKKHEQLELVSTTVQCRNILLSTRNLCCHRHPRTLSPAQTFRESRLQL